MTDDAPELMWSEGLDECDRQWIESFGIADDIRYVEGYLGVIVTIDERGQRRWTPVIGMQGAATDTVVGIWTLAGHQIIAKAHELGQQPS